MNIYSSLNLLDSIPHNKHYLNRYKKFILSRLKRTLKDSTKFEKHHILPKAKDMFPLYENLNKYKWNCIKLSYREHFIAHWLLWKTFNTYSSSRAFKYFIDLNEGKINGKIFQELKSKCSLSTKHFNETRIKNKTHNFLKRPDGSSIASDSVKNGKHNLLKRPDGSSIASDRVKNGTNPFLTLYIGKVACYNKFGTYCKISKETYHSQTGEKENWEYVHVSSKEGKKRKTLTNFPNFFS